jgi:hypothetical protein
MMILKRIIAHKKPLDEQSRRNKKASLKREALDNERGS